MPDDLYRRITAGVDWITLIADGRKQADSLATVVDALARVEGASGASVKPFRFMGFEGRQVGGVRLGFRGADAVTQLSGELCDSSWTRLASLPGRVTRLDLQTTVELSTSLPQFARRLLSPAAKTRHQPPQYRPRIAYSSDTQGLAIGTVGRRTNRRYARVYDKGIEKRSAPSGILWRVELEAKQDLSIELWDSLKSQRDVPAWCYATCESHWKSWGLSWRLPASSDRPEVTKAPRKELAPAHALAAWLRSSVAPTLPRVLTMYSVAELLEQLGIDHLAMPRSEAGNDANE